MTAPYQAVYDAVRSRLSNGDIGRAVENAVTQANISHYVEMASRAIQQAAWDHATPAAIYRPRIFMDGNQWCALYGDDLQDGVAGFGDSPYLACHAFNVAWETKIRDAQLAERVAEEEARETAHADSQ